MFPELQYSRLFGDPKSSFNSLLRMLQAKYLESVAKGCVVYREGRVNRITKKSLDNNFSISK